MKLRWLLEALNYMTVLELYDKNDTPVYKGTIVPEYLLNEIIEDGMVFVESCCLSVKLKHYVEVEQ